MNRERLLDLCRDTNATWDIIVIGGGASGLGAGVDAAARGYRVLTLEQSDFAKATSSRSSKLIHGGVRYLRQGEIPLVLHSLRERGLLTRNAPHLVRPLTFVVPNYEWWEGAYYGVGLWLYDRLAGRLGLAPSRRLSKQETLRLAPTLEPAGLRGGVRYQDAQFDDARLAITLAQTMTDLGGAALNYVKVTGLLKENGRARGVFARDLESGAEFELKARVVVNATGVFADDVRRLDDPGAETMLTPSQGAHIVLDRSFLPGDCAIMAPKTSDGRVLFIIPWHEHLIVGTTDTPAATTPLEPRPLEDEIEFLLVHAARYLTRDPTRFDILSAWAGLRPLVKAGAARRTAKLSRDHTILVSTSGLVTVAGGKWTTYRQMAEETIDRAAETASLPPRPSATRDLRLHGWLTPEESQAALHVYGADSTAVAALSADHPAWDQPLDPRLPIRGREVVWAARHELARTV